MRASSEALAQAGDLVRQTGGTLDREYIIRRIASALTVQREEIEELKKAIARKSAALARPCVSCGYQQKVVRVVASGGLND